MFPAAGQCLGAVEQRTVAANPRRLGLGLFNLGCELLAAPGTLPAASGDIARGSELCPPSSSGVHRGRSGEVSAEASPVRAELGRLVLHRRFLKAMPQRWDLR